MNRGSIRRLHPALEKFECDPAHTPYRLGDDCDGRRHQTGKRKIVYANHGNVSREGSLAGFQSTQRGDKQDAARGHDCRNVGALPQQVTTGLERLLLME